MTEAKKPVKTEPTEEQRHKARVLIQDPEALAKQRLMDFADSLPTGDGYEEEVVDCAPVTYTELIERATAYQEQGEYWSEGGRFEGFSVYDGFWDDYKLVTKKEVKDTWGFFSCSC